MDLQSRSRWVEYSQAKDEMFAYTDEGYVRPPIGDQTIIPELY